MLQDISAQINIPYLQRRAKSNQHKQSPLDELKDAISYLSEKERELQVALEIAKYLLDSNEDLQRKIVKLETNELNLINECRALSQELRTCQALLEEKDIKYERATSTLAQTENELMKLAVDFQRGQAKPSDESFLTGDSFEKELFEMQNSFQSELEKYKSNSNVENCVELEKKSTKFKAEKEKNERELIQTKENYQNLCNKHKRTVDKLRESERVQRIVLDNNEKLEKKYNQAKSNNEKLLEKVTKLMETIEQLEEEAKVLEDQRTKNSGSAQESNSLLYELQCLKETESGKSDESDEEFFSPQNTLKSHEKRNTYTPNFRPQIYPEFFETITYPFIEIPSKGKEIKKDPTEQYFILTVQAVKLNSPHMDTICVIPHATLFQKAISENIPFHKWHMWIETQLNFEYIQSLYQVKPKSQGVRKFLKRF
jgi:myosin heavy subunit